MVSARYDSPVVRGLLAALAEHYVRIYFAHDLDDPASGPLVRPSAGRGLITGTAAGR